jgi:3-oxoacyl-[acyl-carrier protein] reductase
MTGRRRSFMEHWAPEQGMSVEDAMNKFPEKAGITRYGKPEEVADLMAWLESLTLCAQLVSHFHLEGVCLNDE